MVTRPIVFSPPAKLAKNTCPGTIRPGYFHGTSVGRGDGLGTGRHLQAAQGVIFGPVACRHGSCTVANSVDFARRRTSRSRSGRPR